MEQDVLDIVDIDNVIKSYERQKVELEIRIKDGEETVRQMWEELNKRGITTLSMLEQEIEKAQLEVETSNKEAREIMAGLQHVLSECVFA